MMAEPNFRAAARTDAAAGSVQPRPRERYPFWTYGDLLVFAGPGDSLHAARLRRREGGILDPPPSSRGEDLGTAAPSSSPATGCCSACWSSLFRTQYDRPFWRSLGWVTPQLPFYSIVIAGVAPCPGRS